MDSSDWSKVAIELISVAGSILSMLVGHWIGQHDNHKENVDE